MTNPVIMSKIPKNQEETKNISHKDKIKFATYSLGREYYTSDVPKRLDEWKSDIPEKTTQSTLSEFKKSGGHLEVVCRESKDGVKPPEDRIRVIVNKPWYRWAGKSLVFKGEDNTAKQVMRDTCEQHSDVEFIREYIMTSVRLIMAGKHNKNISRKTLNGYWRELVDGRFIIKMDSTVFEDDEIKPTQTPLKENFDSLKGQELFGRTLTEDQIEMLMAILPNNPSPANIFAFVTDHIPINGESSKAARTLVEWVFTEHSQFINELEDSKGIVKHLTIKNGEQNDQIATLNQKIIELQAEVDKLNTQAALPNVPFRDLKERVKQFGESLRS